MVATVTVPYPRPARPGRPSPPARLAPAARPGRTPASTYRRRRVVAASLAVGVVAAARAALGLLGGESLPASERPGLLQAGPPGVAYVVQPGDTFWSIALALAPGRDPRPLVDRLVAAHGGARLQVGERIVLTP